MCTNFYYYYFFYLELPHHWWIFSLILSLSSEQLEGLTEIGECLETLHLLQRLIINLEEGRKGWLYHFTSVHTSDHKNQSYHRFYNTACPFGMFGVKKINSKLRNCERLKFQCAKNLNFNPSLAHPAPQIQPLMFDVEQGGTRMHIYSYWYDQCMVALTHQHKKTKQTNKPCTLLSAF